MDYLGYYKLALQKTYGGNFPEMSSEEFDRRCPLKAVPVALKALYMALGTQRICRMHCLIPMPEELATSGVVVIVHKEDDRVWAINVDDLTEENPLIQARTERMEKEDGTDVWQFSNDGETRLAVQMANLIAYSAISTYEIRHSTRLGKLNAIRNFFALLTRKRELLLNLLCIVLIFIFIKSRISFVLNDISPALSELSILFLALISLIPICSVGRWYFYWNVWIGWKDNSRFASYDDKLLLLIHDLTLQYLRWTRPDLWFNSGAGSVEFHAEVALRNGPERFCQDRYEVISGESGTLTFPDTSPIAYTAEKQCSVLLRTTLDETGCLRFVYINDHCNWRLPKRHRLELNISMEVLTEDEHYQIGFPELVPDKLQNLLRAKCAEFPGIKMAWLCPAIMRGQETYLLSMIADNDVDFNQLVNDAFKISDLPLTGIIQPDAENMEKFTPLYVRDKQGELSNDITMSLQELKNFIDRSDFFEFEENVCTQLGLKHAREEYSPCYNFILCVGWDNDALLDFFIKNRLQLEKFCIVFYRKYLNVSSIEEQEFAQGEELAESDEVIERLPLAKGTIIRVFCYFYYLQTQNYKGLEVLIKKCKIPKCKQFIKELAELWDSCFVKG